MASLQRLHLIWPRSLFGRLLLILFGGLLLAQLISAAVFWLDREQFAFRGSVARAAQRIVDLRTMLNALPAPQRIEVAPKLQRPGFAFAFEKHERRQLGVQQNAELAAMLKQRLGQAGVAADVAVWREDPATRGYDARIVSRLQDGTPLTVYLELLSRPRPWFGGLMERLGILIGIMFVLTLLAVRWVIRPLSMLADAADQLGRNLNAPSLGETGPLEVNRAARAFNTMQERLQRYVRTREEVLAGMSHDLKTPLTRMKLRLETLDDRDVKAAFGRDLDDMQEMVEATLNLMRGLGSEEKTQPVDLRALIESIASDFETAEVTIETRVDVSTALPAKPLALKRCLQNLISNAARYASDVRIAASEADNEVRIVVSDAGPGIAEAELARVLDPYYRVEQSRHRDGGGHGLGLTIAYNLAQLHGGTLSLRNRPEGGLEATLTLPR